MSITSKDRVEKYLLTAIDPSFDNQIDEWILGVEQQIEKMIDRTLFANDVDAEFKYSGNGKEYMMIDDFMSVTSVELDGVDITADVYFEPVNKKPYYKMYYDNGVFERGRQNIIITGKKGYMLVANPKEDLMHAATVLVAGIVNHSKNSSGEVKSESIGRFSVTYTTDSQKTDYQNALTTIMRHRRVR